MSKKYRYSIWCCAEGNTTGTIDLTKKEASIVAYALNQSNWNLIEDEPYSGYCGIDVDNPQEISE